MKAIIYYISVPFIYLVSILPFWMLYGVADFLYVIVYVLLGYRKGVVSQNLRNSFPEKTEKELKQIQRRFYRYFFELMVETIKSLSITPSQLKKRVAFKDTSILEEYHKQNQSIIIAMGHYGNWELGGARFALEPFHKLFVIYRPLRNKYFDQLVYKMRTRLGNGLYAFKNTLRGMVGDRKKLTATAFIADQTPGKQGAYWMEFLNQDTPIFMGTGKIANKFNYPVVYATVNRIKRGYYDVCIEKLVTNSGDTEPEEIISRFTKRLEKDIRQKPEIWLWTHRRWKRKRS